MHGAQTPIPRHRGQSTGLGIPTFPPSPSGPSDNTLVRVRFRGVFSRGGGTGFPVFSTRERIPGAELGRIGTQRSLSLDLLGPGSERRGPIMSPFVPHLLGSPVGCAGSTVPSCNTDQGVRRACEGKGEENPRAPVAGRKIFRSATEVAFGPGTNVNPCGKPPFYRDF